MDKTMIFALVGTLLVGILLGVAVADELGISFSSRDREIGSDLSASKLNELRAKDLDVRWAVQMKGEKIYGALVVNESGVLTAYPPIEVVTNWTIEKAYYPLLSDDEFLDLRLKEFGDSFLEDYKTRQPEPEIITLANRTVVL